MRILAVIVVLLVGCKDKAKQEPAKPPEPTGSGSTAATGSGATAAASAADAAPAKDERCDSPCRFLADTPLADIAAKVKTTCGTEWPAASGDDCAQLDYQRNCI